MTTVGGEKAPDRDAIQGTFLPCGDFSFIYALHIGD